MSVLKKIYKYNMDIKYSCVLEIPVDGQILSVDMHAGMINFWILVDPLLDKEIRTFEVYRTGDEIFNSEFKDYIFTVKDIEINDVYHIFEIK